MLIKFCIIICFPHIKYNENKSLGGIFIRDAVGTVPECAVGLFGGRGGLITRGTIPRVVGFISGIEFLHSVSGNRKISGI